jgi:uncharacterized membrane protein YidH (DUF202 family)
VNERVTESPPIPEARPPHLPDVLTRTAPGFFAFVLVAVVTGWADIRSWLGDYPIFDPSTVWPLVVQLVQSVVPPLLGAALFLRHPRAHRTMPLLVFGLALLAAGELLDVVSSPISQFLRSLSPDELPPSPADIAFLVFTTLLSLFAILYVGAGLAAARRRERVAAERPLVIWIVALAIVSGILSLASVFQLPIESTPFVLVQLAIGLVLSMLVTLAWAYLMAMSVGGWMAGEEPRRAWGIAALAIVVLFVTRLGGGVLSSLAVAGLFGIVEILFAASTLAWLLLLAAFLLGLPAPRDDRPAETQPDSAAG